MRKEVVVGKCNIVPDVKVRLAHLEVPTLKFIITQPSLSL